MIEIKNVSKTYSMQHGCAVEALKDISLSLSEKGMVFLVGKSGSGKTTLVNLIGGIDTPTKGEIIFNGISSKLRTPQQYDAYRNQYIGLVFQEYNLIKDFSVRENIALAMELQGKIVEEEHVDKILSLVGLSGYGNRKPHELSGGQQQRVAIARALAKDPRVIVADEPTGALDTATGQQVMDILKQLAAERLVVVVSHDREMAETYADRCIELVDGRICSDTIDQSWQTSKENMPLHHIKPQPSKQRKANLSIKSALKIGRNCIRKKKLRFIAVITLSIAAFTFLGLADMLASYNKQTTFVNSLFSTDANYVSIKKAVCLSYNSEATWYDNGFHLDQEDIDALYERTGILYKGVYIPPFVNLNIEKNYGSAYAKNSTYQSYVSDLSGFVEFSEKDLEVFGYNLLAGRLPEANKDEIAVSQYVYDSFRLVSYANYTGPVITTDTGETLSWDEFQQSNVRTCKYNYNPTTQKQEIKKPEDLIGKTIFLGSRNYTITGIIDTNFDLSSYTGLTKPTANKDTDSLDLTSQLKLGKLEYERKYSLHCAIFVGEGKVDEIISRYPSVVTVDDMTLSFNNAYARFSSNIIARMSDVDLSNRGLQWINRDSASDQITQQPNMTDEYIHTNLEGFEILVPAEMIMASYIQVGDKLYQEVGGNVSKEMKCTNLKMTLTYGDDRYGEESNGWEVIGTFNGKNFGELYSIENIILVSDEFFEKISEGRKGVYTHAVAPTPKTKGEIKNMISVCEGYSSSTRFSLMNAVSYELNTLDHTFASVAKICRYVGIGFALFSIFLFSNFILASIAERKGDIGIMRALGARRRDVFFVFFTESIIIATANFVLSCLLTYITAFAGNYVMKHQFGLLISFVSFGIRQVIILFCLSFAIALIASYIPIKRVAKLSPVEAIRRV